MRTFSITLGALLLTLAQLGEGKGGWMLIVDIHCHALSHWFEPVEVLLHQMHANGAAKALLV